MIHKRQRQLPEGLAEVKALIERKIKPVSILDVLCDTEKWLNWTQCFGPLSGFDAKITDPVERYITTTFCYGCNYVELIQYLILRPKAFLEKAFTLLTCLQCT